MSCTLHKFKIFNQGWIRIHTHRHTTIHLQQTLKCRENGIKGVIYYDYFSLISSNSNPYGQIREGFLYIYIYIVVWNENESIISSNICIINLHEGSIPSNSGAILFIRVHFIQIWRKTLHKSIHVSMCINTPGISK